MEYLEQVQRGLDYIEANLDVEISACEVARRAAISRWHFQRIFKALTNETLKTYIRSRRFARSRERLAHTSERVLEIAISSGFESQASFTRAFRKAFGVTPAQYRRTPHFVSFPAKIRIDADYLSHIHHYVSLEPELVDMLATRVVGMRTRLFGPDSEKNNIGKNMPRLWARFLPHARSVPHREPSWACGVLHPATADTEELEYWASVPVTHTGAPPAGLSSFQIREARYALFLHRGPITAIDHTVNYIYSNWLLRSGARHTYGCDLEIYDERYKPGSEDSVMQYAIPIER